MVTSETSSGYDKDHREFIIIFFILSSFHRKAERPKTLRFFLFSASVSAGKICFARDYVVY